MQEKSLVKKNILQYIDFKGISRYKFYQQTGITRGILDQNNGISEENITRFLAYYSDVSAEWLLRNEGEMLKKYENTQALSILAEESEVYGAVNYKEKYFETLEKLNQANERLLALTDIKKELIKKK